jgi:hypothetical protein
VPGIEAGSFERGAISESLVARLPVLPNTISLFWNDESQGDGLL